MVSCHTVEIINICTIQSYLRHSVASDMVVYENATLLLSLALLLVTIEGALFDSHVVML